MKYVVIAYEENMCISEAQQAADKIKVVRKEKPLFQERDNSPGLSTAKLIKSRVSGTNSRIMGEKL
jgi:hypothetical protein